MIAHWAILLGNSGSCSPTLSGDLCVATSALELAAEFLTMPYAVLHLLLEAGQSGAKEEKKDPVIPASLAIGFCREGHQGEGVVVTFCCSLAGENLELLVPS